MGQCRIANWLARKILRRFIRTFPIEKIVGGVGIGSLAFAVDFEMIDFRNLVD
jgi:hypothetical protein